MFVESIAVSKVKFGQKKSEGDKRSLQRKNQCSISFLLYGLNFFIDFTYDTAIESYEDTLD